MNRVKNETILSDAPVTVKQSSKKKKNGSRSRQRHSASKQDKCHFELIQCDMTKTDDPVSIAHDKSDSKTNSKDMLTTNSKDAAGDTQKNKVKPKDTVKSEPKEKPKQTRGSRDSKKNVFIHDEPDADKEAMTTDQIVVIQDKNHKNDNDGGIVSKNIQDIEIPPSFNVGTVKLDKPLSGPLVVSLPRPPSPNNTYYETYFNYDGTMKPLVIHADFDVIFKNMIMRARGIELGMNVHGPNVLIDMENDKNANEKLRLFSRMLSHLEQSKIEIQAVKNVPASFSLVKFIPGIYNQGSMGSCYANAIAQIINIARAASLALQWKTTSPHMKLSDVLQLIWDKRPSRMFIEYNADRIQTQITGDTVFSQGAYDWSAMQSIKEYGAPAEVIYDYPLANNISLIQFSRLPEATRHQIMIEFYQKQMCPPDAYIFAQAKYENDMKTLHWYMLSNPSMSLYVKDLTPFDVLKNLIMQFISVHIPLYLGMPVYDSWYRLPSTRNSVIPLNNDKEEIAGFHAVVICGYDNEFIEIANSWGTQTGDHGIFKMPWTYLKKNLKYSVVVALVSEDWEQYKSLIVKPNAQ